MSKIRNNIVTPPIKTRVGVIAEFYQNGDRIKTVDFITDTNRFYLTAGICGRRAHEDLNYFPRLHNLVVEEIPRPSENIQDTYTVILNYLCAFDVMELIIREYPNVETGVLIRIDVDDLTNFRIWGTSLDLISRYFEGHNVCSLDDPLFDSNNVVIDSCRNRPDQYFFISGVNQN